MQKKQANTVKKYNHLIINQLQSKKKRHKKKRNKY
nr:MAG TPA: hypothetical protein [Caudoviricetes sp.]